MNPDKEERLAELTKKRNRSRHGLSDGIRGQEALELIDLQRKALAERDNEIANLRKALGMEKQK